MTVKGRITDLIQYSLNLSYTYWEDGRIKKAQDVLAASNTLSYEYSDSYDANGQLTKCAVGSTQLTYTYDNVGNRTQETIGGTVNNLSYVYGTNKLASATVSGVYYNLTHDDAGNLTGKTASGNSKTFGYDYNNMLARAYITINGNNREITNTYGSGGSVRIKKTDNGAVRYYSYNGGKMLCEYDAGGTVKKKYVYALGKCIATIDSAGNKTFNSHDAQGSVKLISDVNGSVIKKYAYYPFGDSLTFTGTAANDLRYTEQQYVDGIEAYDYNARYYDQKLGRFYGMDPIFSPGISPYAYCDNDPVNRIDPTGMIDFVTPPGYSGNDPRCYVEYPEVIVEGDRPGTPKAMPKLTWADKQRMYRASRNRDPLGGRRGRGEDRPGGSGGHRGGSSTTSTGTQHGATVTIGTSLAFSTPVFDGVFALQSTLDIHGNYMNQYSIAVGPSLMSGVEVTITPYVAFTNAATTAVTLGEYTETGFTAATLGGISAAFIEGDGYSGISFGPTAGVGAEVHRYSGQTDQFTWGVYDYDYGK